MEKLFYILRTPRNITLEWGYGKSYRNEIDVWGENDGMYSEKIFLNQTIFHHEHY